jgi:histidine ammonia-lyase
LFGCKDASAPGLDASPYFWPQNNRAVATLTISSFPLTLNQLSDALHNDSGIELSAESLAAVARCREQLDRLIERSPAPIYGINTGFGSLCNTAIPANQLEKLQENLVLSHACGTGPELERDLVRLMLLLKIKGLSLGHSGVTTATVERLTEMFNRDILPVIPEQGSLGASGDLAPLAHLSLPLLGQGEVRLKGEKMTSSEMLSQTGLHALRLQSKEGLALLNGTQFMSAHLALLVLRAQRLADWADIIAAISLEAYDGRPEPFGAEVNGIRNHPGQIHVARRMRELLSGSQLIHRHKDHVQDPYSFRCVPQVHGASRDALAHAEAVLLREINAVTDNPTVFPDEEMVVSAGNFHGQPLAITIDFLCIALAEWGSISERRTYKLISGTRELPAFLTPEPGLNSGFMIPQYTAASLVSQNKHLCSPASVDTIDSSNGQEDHVSMGANAATKALRVLKNTEQILAIELMNAAQALDLRGANLTSPFLQKVHSAYRQQVPFLTSDAYLSPLMAKSLHFLKTIDF